MAASADTAHLILALDTHADALRLRSVADACSGSFWSERFGERGMRRIEEDAQHHISQLKVALQFGDPAILEKYAIWLQQVLTHRGMCSHHLAEHFQAMARAIRHEALPGARMAETYLQRGADALDYGSGPAHSVHAAIPPLTGSMLAALRGPDGVALDPDDHLVHDVGYLLSYLTDAVALDQPDVFAQYVRWIDGYFTRRQRPAEYLSKLLQALLAALDDLGGGVRDVCRPIVVAARATLNAAVSAE